MAGEKTERVFAPAYLWEFRCDSAACGSRCCKGWRIPVDAAARERFSSLSPERREEIFSKLVENGTGWETEKDAEGNCAFLRGDGLCRLQKAYDEAMLPDICDSYPRVSYRFSGFSERSLALTCPVAARLALLPEAPMRFAERTVPARRASPASKPPMEALRWESGIRALQLQMIAFLQNREQPLRQRFLRLGRFLAALGERFGEGLPDGEALAACAKEAAPVEKPSPRAPSFARFRYMAGLVAELYGAEENNHYTPARLDALAACLSERAATGEEALQARYGHVLENLAVNELFLRLYPFSCSGGFFTNFKLFVLRFRVAGFPLLLKSVGQGGVPDTETALLLVGRVMEKLDHNREADRLLKRRAAEDFRGMDVDEFLSFL